MRFFLTFYLVIVILLLCLVSGCNSSQPANRGSQPAMSKEALQGERVFKMQCSICHNANSTQALHGPGLKGLYHRQALPSGIPLTDEHVRQNIVRGRAMMPPFGNILDEQQINDLIAYLKTI